MVTVVKRCEADPETFHEAVCDNCGATLSYSSYELKTKYRKDSLWPGDVRYVTCPDCRQHVLHRYTSGFDWAKMFDLVKNRNES